MQFTIYRKGKPTIVLIDDQDWHVVRQYNWIVEAKGYIGSDSAGRRVRLHRLLLGLTYGDGWSVDHINGNPADNRRQNLRVCTNAENHRNTKAHKGSLSGVAGVTLHKLTGKWRARLCLNRKNFDLGQFASKEEAIAARKEAEVKLFGEFAPSLCRGQP